MDKEIRILLVDDEPLVRRSIEKTLSRAGFDVETAADSAAGLKVFEVSSQREVGEGTGPFDLAILDLHMPNLEGQDDSDAGLKLLTKLLEIDAGLPVIVLTAFDEVARAKDAVSRGARAYFVKGREAGLLELVDTIMSEEKI